MFSPESWDKLYKLHRIGITGDRLWQWLCFRQFASKAAPVTQTDIDWAKRKLSALSLRGGE